MRLSTLRTKQGSVYLLKVIIVIVMIAMIISLLTGLGFLLKDTDKPGSRRTHRVLGIRVGLAITLMVLIGYGLATDQLAISAPWHNPSAGTAP